MKIQGTCLFCNLQTELVKRKETLLVKGFFCSKECYKNYVKEKTKRKCLSCNLYFYGKRQKFCSDKCQWNFHHKEIICKFCSISFIVKKSKGENCQFCSRSCQLKFSNSTTKFICTKCGKEFFRKKWERKRTKNPICSIKCYKKSLKKELVCICGKSFEAYPSRIKYYSELFCSCDCRIKNQGTLNPKPNLDPEYEKFSRSLRSKAKYLIWKKNCLERDNFSCNKCGRKSQLTVHHLQTVWSFVERHGMNIEEIETDPLFYNIENGITLCRACHMSNHKKG